ncbi:TIGR03032 family protein [Cylindrospermum stagnale PCC 7417]|uniref:protein O-GlcNAc transferase n=1 Tax=Cylindrospermum stagnale PCC 7417 TaxID=56107 RepID=K9X281_9NOST|nr:TIGR03032 family protein [Cylindrospermum stagnale]AFZ26553.1 TIGR03032 family protein [Cylindrospermum stagnale PCC 7417]
MNNTAEMDIYSDGQSPAFSARPFANGDRETLLLSADRTFTDWLAKEQISIAYTTYQTSRLMLIGVNPENGRISGFERLFERAMGLYTTAERIYLSSKYQLWQMDNVLELGQTHDGYDKLYIPRIGYTTGDIDVHDVAVDGTGKLIFISSLLNCLATVSDRHSCIPLWKPPFISKIVNEDRCHLNGLGMVEGQPRYVTVCSRSDVVDGWRDRRQDGGCVVDIPSNEIICTGLSMPHSPRWYRDKLWLLNSGKGEFGYVDLRKGKFESVAFCPGFMRGLAFWGNYAIVGLSKPRGDKTFTGLDLDEELRKRDAEPRCGLMVIDLRTGAIAHWVRIEGIVTELYDVQILPGVKRPMALGFQNEEIQQIITLDPQSSLVGVNLPSVTRESAENRNGDNLPLMNATENQNLFNPEARLYQQGLAWQNSGQYHDAIAQYQQLITQYPEYAPAWYQLGVIVDNLGQRDEAALAYQKALTINPNYAEAHNNLGIVRVAEKNLAAAISCFTAAIKSKPDYAFAHNNLGLVWQMQTKFAEAAAKFREALQINPEYAEAYLNLGMVLEAQGNLQDAIACYRSAVRHKTDYIKADNRLGLALIKLAMVSKGDVEEARGIFEQVLKLQPDSAEAFTHLVYLKEMSCDWRDRQSDLTRIGEQTQRELQTGQSTTIAAFDTLYKPWERTLLLQVAQTHGTAMETQWTQMRQALNFTHSRSLTGRLKIGYLSSDFRNHAMSHLIRGLFRCHNRDNFEIFAYSTGPDDNSEYRRYIASQSEHFQDIATLSTEESARLIFAHGIHILIDLNAYTAGSRSQIFALKPAPIQVNHVGFPGTMGADFIDYIIGDAIVTPPEFAEAFSEKIVTLPHSYYFTDNQQAISSTPITRSQYGLPESGFVFCCFNNNYKIEPLIFDAWMRILADVPEGVLWLLPRFPVAKENLRREAEMRGISEERLIFADVEPKPEHLARHRLADLFLDTLYYNAHTSATDALWAGLPVITCPGTTFASRVAASLLTAVGLPELVTANLQEYEQLAINLAKSPGELLQLKQKLAQNRTTHPLFDTSRFTRNLEQAYSKMWEVYAAGKSPQSIQVSDIQA